MKKMEEGKWQKDKSHLRIDWWCGRKRNPDGIFVPNCSCSCGSPQSPCHWYAVIWRFGDTEWNIIYSFYNHQFQPKSCLGFQPSIWNISLSWLYINPKEIICQMKNWNALVTSKKAGKFIVIEETISFYGVKRVQNNDSTPFVCINQCSQYLSICCCIQYLWCLEGTFIISSSLF